MAKVKATSVTLLVLEIGLWMYVCLLLTDVILNPPQRWLVRVEDRTVHPPMVISDTPQSDVMPPHPLRWLEPPSLRAVPPPFRAWREQQWTGRGPVNSFGMLISQPSVPWVITRILTTMAVGGLAIGLVRQLRSRLPKARGFEVELTHSGAEAR